MAQEKMTMTMNRSVKRAVSILNAIGGEVRGISEISQQLNLSKGTIFSLIKTLEDTGFVIQDPVSEKYMLGPALLKLSSLKMRSMKIESVARPHLQRLADLLGEITHLAVRDGFHSLYVLRMESRNIHRMMKLHSQIGGHSPLHCTSTGKVLMEAMTEEEFEELADQGFKRYTPLTIVDRHILWDEIRDVQKTGYAHNFGEYEEGLNSIAVPIKNTNQVTIAAINVAAPSARMPEDKIPFFYKHLKHIANCITEEMDF
jgi:IclR family KDG regulon transcriptional repressor